MTIFKKKSKKTYFGATLSTFWTKLAKMNFLEKRALSVLKYPNYLPSLQKIRKTNQPFLRKMPN